MVGHGAPPLGEYHGLDLNSQASAFPHLSAYSNYVQPSAEGAEAAGGNKGGRATRGGKGGRGVAAARATSSADALARPPAAFRAPRTAGAGGGRGGRGRSQSVGGAQPRSASVVATDGAQRRSASAAATNRGQPRAAATDSEGNASAHGGSRVSMPQQSGGSRVPTPQQSGDLAAPANGDDNTENQDETLGQDPLMDEEYDKANWNSENTHTFCDICIEEMRAGNSNNGFITNRGYKNIAEKYYISTRLRHCRKQLKNRWDQLKGLYQFWLRINKQTGGGRARGTQWYTMMMNSEK